ncbi:hypothetical protein, partial [Streptomyces niveiscabiei]
HVARIRETARKLSTPAPMWCAYDLWVRAELQRAQGRDTVDEWSDVVTAFECLERPYDLARVRYRLAERLVVAGGDDE